MRLWHYALIRYLPKSQLLAQWRELNSIFKKQDDHILIRYIYKYDKEYLRDYSWSVITEMNRRGYKIKSLDNMEKYFGKGYRDWTSGVRFPEHNQRYLLQCFYNLQEKYDRGQKGFTLDVYRKLLDVCWKEYNERS